MGISSSAIGRDPVEQRGGDSVTNGKISDDERPGYWKHKDVQHLLTF